MSHLTDAERTLVQERDQRGLLAAPWQSLKCAFQGHDWKTFANEQRRPTLLKHRACGRCGVRARMP